MENSFRFCICFFIGGKVWRNLGGKMEGTSNFQIRKPNFSKIIIVTILRAGGVLFLIKKCYTIT